MTTLVWFAKTMNMAMDRRAQAVLAALFLLTFWGLASGLALAAEDTEAPTAPLRKNLATKNHKWKSPVVCKARHLSERDCMIRLGDYRLHVWRDKIFLNSGVDRKTKSLPGAAEVPADAIQWEFVRGQDLGGRKILELGLWAPPRGESEVETLNWIVFEATRDQLFKRVEKSIQKRKKWADGKYKHDRAEATQLEFKNGHVLWSAGKEKGEF